MLSRRFVGGQDGVVWCSVVAFESNRVAGKDSCGIVWDGGLRC
jgi:hypothetical protein